MVKKVSLTICRDFRWHENDIDQHLKSMLTNKLGIDIGNPRHQTLPDSSNAHEYAYLMYKDSHNKLSIYEDIKLEDLNPFLIKIEK